MQIDDQIRQGWKDYYRAIGAGDTVKAKRIFDSVSALASAQLARKTTARMTATVKEYTSWIR